MSTRCEVPDGGSSPFNGSSPYDGGAYPLAVSAGDILVSGPLLDGGVVLPGSLPYQPVYLSQALWSAPGQTLVFSSTGGTVPAFTGQLLTTPSVVTVTPSLLCPNTPCVVNRGSSFTVTWTGGTLGEVGVTLFVMSPSVWAYSVLECSFPASTGTGTIPLPIMAGLVGGTGLLWVTSTTSSHFDSGGFDVQLVAQAVAFSSTAEVQ